MVARLLNVKAPAAHGSGLAARAAAIACID